MTNRYSSNDEENAIIQAAIDLGDPGARHFYVHREWDGDELLSSAPASRVHPVDVYDAEAWVKADMPKDLTPFWVGKRMEKGR